MPVAVGLEPMVALGDDFLTSRLAKPGGVLKATEGSVLTSCRRQRAESLRSRRAAHALGFLKSPRSKDRGKASTTPSMAPSIAPGTVTLASV